MKNESQPLPKANKYFANAAPKLAAENSFMNKIQLALRRKMEKQFFEESVI